MSATFSSLEKEYCPPLDSALYAAIVSDFDLNDPEAVQQARETLDAVKISALEQDSTVFDPSGSAFRTSRDGAEDLSETASQSHETDLTSLSNDVQSLNFKSDAGGDVSNDVPAEDLDDASKVALLKDMFPESGEFAISHTLSKCEGSWQRALEELLNHTFFNSGGNGSDGEGKINVKGVEAFSEDHITRRGRKKKKPAGHRKPPKEELPLRSSSLPNSVVVNPWERTKQDIDFLEARTNATRRELSSLYHQQGASLHAVIFALIGSLSTADISMDKTAQGNIHELGRDFPTLSPKHLAGLIHLTQPSTAAAHELAKALTTPEPGTRGECSIEVIPKYAPITIDTENSDDEPSWSVARARTAHSSGTSTPISSMSSDPVAQANHYLTAQQRSFAQAAAAYRRGKSDHLMSAAAGYYSQQGRDFAKQRAEATAEVADALVASQSSKGEIDLHGVSVKDAVRISKIAVQQWWRARGNKVKGLDGRVTAEDSSADGHSQALRIVTGVGRHSYGGKGKIGPAVGRMLVSEGWSFKAEEGVLTVYGKR